MEYIKIALQPWTIQSAFALRLTRARNTDEISGIKILQSARSFHLISIINYLRCNASLIRTSFFNDPFSILRVSAFYFILPIEIYIDWRKYSSTCEIPDTCGIHMHVCVIQNILYVIGHDYHGLIAKDSCKQRKCIYERNYKILMTNIYFNKITKLFKQLIVHYIGRSWYLNDINWLFLILFNTNHTFKAMLYTNVLLSVYLQ